MWSAKSAQSRRPRPTSDAAMRPVEPDFGAPRSMFERRIYTTRTEPPFAFAAIADAAFPRTCGGVISAKQRISPNQTLSRADLAGFQTALSLLEVRTEMERDKTHTEFCRLNVRLLASSLNQYRWSLAAQTAK